MEFELSGVAQALGVRVESDARITGWSIDSRTVAPGDLFFALRGPNHDGNVYVEEVLRKGAVAAVANDAKPGRVLVVPDTLEALQGTAVWALGQWGGEVIGVTGSAGKTSTKDVIAELLGVGMPVGKTIGNLNNHVGVPLSILRLPGEARVAVLEMGMNHAGEIRALCAIAKPRIGVSGLNPHAGEHGLWGDEEAREIAPAIAEARVLGIDAAGPFGADVMLAHAGCDAYVVMLHDQGHIPVKLEPGGVAFSIGAPMLFAGVTHGSAHDIAGKGIADPSSLANALRWCIGARAPSSS